MRNSFIGDIEELTDLKGGRYVYMIIRKTFSDDDSFVYETYIFISSYDKDINLFKSAYPLDLESYVK